MSNHSEQLHKTLTLTPIPIDIQTDLQVLSIAETIHEQTLAFVEQNPHPHETQSWRGNLKAAHEFLHGHLHTRANKRMCANRFVLAVNALDTYWGEQYPNWQELGLFHKQADNQHTRTSLEVRSYSLEDLSLTYKENAERVRLAAIPKPVLQ